MYDFSKHCHNDYNLADVIEFHFLNYSTRRS